LVQLDNGYQCINRIYKSIECCARTRVRIGGGGDRLVVFWFWSYAVWETTALHSAQNKNRPEGRMQPSDLVLNIALDLDQQSSADKKGFDRVAVEIFDADLLVPSHCMMRAMPRVDLLGHPLFVRFRRQSHPS
jgi:hypothetical protein